MLRAARPLRSVATLMGALALMAVVSASATASTPAQEWPPGSLPTLPPFLLPYDSSTDTVVWTGGPHPYNRGGDLNGQYRYGEGSGLDFAEIYGRSFPILAMAAGDVIESGCGYAGLGCLVAVRHTVGGTVLIYAHLERGSLIEAGASVAQGQMLGQAGDSGGQTNIHLHIELRDGGVCEDALHTQCGDIGWAGNPVGWERGLLFVDGYRITGYCVVRNDDDASNCFELPTARYFAYDGAAFRGVSASTEYNFRYDDIDELGRSSRVRAAAIVEPSFSCPARGDCERSATSPFMLFAGHGLFGTGGGPNPGGELVSTNRLPAPEVPDSFAEGPARQVALQRGAGLFLLDTATGEEQVILDVEELHDEVVRLNLTWSADGSRLAFATAGDERATIPILTFDEAGNIIDWVDLPFAPEAVPLPAFDRSDPDLLYYATVDPLDTAIVDLYAYSLSAGVESWIYRMPDLGPCRPFKMTVIGDEEFGLLELCGTGAGNWLGAIEIARYEGIFKSVWQDHLFADYWFLDQPVACEDNAPQVLDLSLRGEVNELAFVLSPDCFDPFDGGTYSGSEEVAVAPLDERRPSAAHQFASEGIVRVDATRTGGMLYLSEEGTLWWQSDDGSPRDLIAEGIDAMAQRPEAQAVTAPNSRNTTEPALAVADLVNLSLRAVVTASSALPSDRYGSYGAAQAADGSRDTAWSEAVDGPGLGEWLHLEFGFPVVIDHLEIAAGYDSDTASFAANNRVAAAKVTFDDGRSFQIELDDARGLQVISIPWEEIGQGTVTRSLRFTVDDIYPGAKFDDTCIAELQVWGVNLEE